MSAADLRPPKLQEILLQANDTFLRASWDVVVRRRVALPNLGDQVSYAVFGQLMQLARTVHRLAGTGYGGEAKPIARAALSATTSIKAILAEDLCFLDDEARRAEVDGRALQYIFWEQEIRKRRNAGYVRAGLVPNDAADENLARAESERAKKAEELREKGVEPRRIADGNESWHGLSERQMMLRLDLEDWYAVYYGNFSEEAHVSVAAVRTQLVSLWDKNSLVVGPQWEDPSVPLRAVVDAISGALLSLDRSLNLKAAAETRANADQMIEALKDYWGKLPPEERGKLFL